MMKFPSLTAISLAVALTLSACGSKEPGSSATLSSVMASTLKARISALTKEAPAPAEAQPQAQDPQAALAALKAALAQSPSAVIQIIIPRSGFNALGTGIAEQSTSHVYKTPTGQGVSLRNGYLSATRGFGNDLMSAETPPGMPGDNAPRIHYFIDSLNQSQAETFACTWESAGTELLVTPLGAQKSTTRYDETCTGAQNAFINSYWIGASSVVWKSHQWINPQIGHAIIHVLKP